MERRRDEGDRRAVRLYATELGRRKCQQAMSHLALWSVLLVLVGGTAVLGCLAAKTFTRRVLN